MRPGSWDDAICATVFGGEYGPIEVRGKTVVDVGAHIGAFAILAARAGARRVLAYEPEAENFRLLTLNAAPYAAIEPHRAAVWRSDRDERELWWRASSNAGNTGGGTVLACAAVGGLAPSATRTARVDAVALDAILDRVGPVGLLKIDAEGSEYPVLATSRRLDRVAAIVGEFHAVDGATPPLPGLDAWTGDALMDLLDDRGFEVAVQPVGETLGLFRAMRR
jgi:FkbM family methyltransferase